MKKTLKLCSIDIGKKNFAFYVEEINIDTITNLRNIYNNLPKKFQRKTYSNMPDQISDILDKLYLDGKKIEMNVFDIRDDKESNELTNNVRINMHNLLSSYEYIWDDCDIIVIEQQFCNITEGGKKTHSAKGFGINLDAIKLAECCLNWFLIKYGMFKEVVFFGSVYKTQTLGAPPKLTKPQRKKWSIDKAMNIFNLRNDLNSIEELTNKKTHLNKKQKGDDMADCVIMLQAYKFRKLIME